MRAFSKRVCLDEPRSSVDSTQAGASRWKRVSLATFRSGAAGFCAAALKDFHFRSSATTPKGEKEREEEEEVKTFLE